MIAPEPNQQMLFQTWPENAQIGSKYVVILHFLVHVESIVLLMPHPTIYRLNTSMMAARYMKPFLMGM